MLESQTRVPRWLQKPKDIRVTNDSVSSPGPIGLTRTIASVAPVVIVTGVSIGSGEWLLGPASAVKFGTWILFIATVSIVLQHLFNNAVMRYTLCTGETIQVGLIRTGPDFRIWLFVYGFMALMQVMWPGYVASCAASYFFAIKGVMPQAVDQPAIYQIGILSLMVCVAIVVFGGVISSTMRIVNYVLVCFILIVVVVSAVLLVPVGHIWRVFLGFFGIGPHSANLSSQSDWLLLAGFAGYAGAGGIFNMLITNQYRDAGYGAAAKKPPIGGLIGKRRNSGGENQDEVLEMPDPSTAENQSRLKLWFAKFSREHTIFWTIPCFLSMFLTTALYTYFLEPGSSLSGQGASAELVNALKSGGHISEWYSTILALCGFAVLFSSQFTVVDCVGRQVTDVLWACSPRIRTLTAGDRSRLYYAIIITFTTASAFLLGTTPPLTLIKIMSYSASAILGLSGIHVYLLLRSRLPRFARSPVLDVGLILCTLVFGGICILALII